MLGQGLRLKSGKLVPGRLQQGGGLQAGLFEDGVSGKEGRHGGFGLAIVRSLAEQMGGTVGCDSRPGGTIFTLTLPV